MTAMQHHPDLQASTLPDPATLRTGFVTPLSDLGLLRFSGADAVGFLHRQLTNDLERLRTSEARLAGYCTAQGRLLATLLVWKSGDDVMLQLPREILSGIQKRLQMFVLRDKVQITDDSETSVQIGLGGTAATTALATWYPALPPEPYGKVDNENGALIRLADAFDAPRYLWITRPETFAPAWTSLAASLTPVREDAWSLANIEAGIAQITISTQEKLVAQMVNLDLVGGVNFRKGCYPGQEIVARTQYLGKARRRMLKASISQKDGAPAAGTDIFVSNDPTQPCGIIVNAERRTPEEIVCLVSLRLPMPDGTTVRLGAADGAPLHFEPLPYPLPDDGAPS